MTSGTIRSLLKQLMFAEPVAAPDRTVRLWVEVWSKSAESRKLTRLKFFLEIWLLQLGHLANVLFFVHAKRQCSQKMWPQSVIRPTSYGLRQIRHIELSADGDCLLEVAAMWSRYLCFATRRTMSFCNCDSSLRQMPMSASGSTDSISRTVSEIACSCR